MCSQSSSLIHIQFRDTKCLPGQGQFEQVRPQGLSPCLLCSGPHLSLVLGYDWRLLLDVLTSMFLQATFFTTAGNRSEAFFPRAIIWVLGQMGKGGRGGSTLMTTRPYIHPGSLFLDTQT